MRKKPNKKIFDNEDSTFSILLKKYNGNEVPRLEDICDEYFNINYDTAKKKANWNKLPIPAFRQGNSQKLPFVINLRDLAQLIEKRTVKAHLEWQKFQEYCNDL